MPAEGDRVEEASGCGGIDWRVADPEEVAAAFWRGMIDENKAARSIVPHISRRQREDSLELWDGLILNT